MFQLMTKTNTVPPTSELATGARIKRLGASVIVTEHVHVDDRGRLVDPQTGRDLDSLLAVMRDPSFMAITKL